MFLNNTYRHQRIWFVFGAIWIFIANIIYFINLNLVECTSKGYDFPIFYELWTPFAFHNKDLFPYSIKHFAFGDQVCNMLTYSFTGHMYFVLMPCILIWITYFSIEWIKKGKVR